MSCKGGRYFDRQEKTTELPKTDPDFYLVILAIQTSGSSTSDV